MQRYLVTQKGFAPFFTEWFDAENHFSTNVEMTVYDLVKKIYTTDGLNWNNIQIDKL